VSGGQRLQNFQHVRHRAVSLRHPWPVQVSIGYIPRGPNALDLIDHSYDLAVARLTKAPREAVDHLMDDQMVRLRADMRN
jgi:hypothetical protein